jgi:hypothetical protein
VPLPQPARGVVLGGLILAGGVGGTTAWAYALLPVFFFKPLAESKLQYWVVFPLTMYLVIFAGIAIVGAVLIGGVLHKLVVSKIGFSWPTSIALGAFSGGSTFYLLSFSKGIGPFLLGAAAGVGGGVAFHLYVRSKLRSHDPRQETA